MKSTANKNLTATLICLIFFIHTESNAKVCSQQLIRQEVVKVAMSSGQFLDAGKITIGQETYIGNSTNAQGYFPVFYENADCAEFGTPRCKLTGIIYASLKECLATHWSVGKSIGEFKIKP